jgi:hypothetical protein
MKKRLLFLTVFLWVHIAVNAQETNISKHKAPISIYTFNALKKDMQSISSLSKRLNIRTFSFILADAHNIDQKIHPLNFKEIGDNVPTYVYDSYEKYQDNTFLKEFLFDNDPTRWNLQCIENRIPPNAVNK